MAANGNRHNQARPRRTVGLALAILVSIMWFSVFPLLQTGIILVLDWRLRQSELALGSAGDLPSFAVGGDFRGVSDAALWFQTLSALVFLVIGVIAWRGRPKSIRWVMMAAVILLTLVTVLTTVEALGRDASLEGGIDSGASVAAALLNARLVVGVLIPLYTLWYMNRAPARAFYRGYYLPVPEGEADC